MRAELERLGLDASRWTLLSVVLVLLVVGAVGAAGRDQLALGSSGLPILAMVLLGVAAVVMVGGLVLIMMTVSWRARIGALVGVLGVLAVLGFLLSMSEDPEPVPPPDRDESTVEQEGSDNSGIAGEPFWSWRDVVIVLAVMALVALTVWWLVRQRQRGARELTDVRTDLTELARHGVAAVAAGRAALLDDHGSRGAVIACYVAMENALAERGLRRRGDTPTDLLNRAVDTGAFGQEARSAATELADLFRLARFSHHPMPAMARSRAEAALARLSTEFDAIAGARKSSR